MEGFTKEGKCRIPIEPDKLVEMIKTEAKMDVLEETLFSSSDLSFNRKRLTFDDTTVSAMVRALFPARYEQRMKELEKEEEA